MRHENTVFRHLKNLLGMLLKKRSVSHHLVCDAGEFYYVPINFPLRIKKCGEAVNFLGSIVNYDGNLRDLSVMDGSGGFNIHYGELR